MEQNKELEKVLDFHNRIASAKKLLELIRLSVAILSAVTSGELKLSEEAKNSTEKVVFELSERLCALFGKLPTTEELKEVNKTATAYMRSFEKLTEHILNAIDFEAGEVIDKDELYSVQLIVEDSL